MLPWLWTYMIFLRFFSQVPELNLETDNSHFLLYIHITIFLHTHFPSIVTLLTSQLIKYHYINQTYKQKRYFPVGKLSICIDCMSMNRAFSYIPQRTETAQSLKWLLQCWMIVVQSLPRAEFFSPPLYLYQPWGPPSFLSTENWRLFLWEWSYCSVLLSYHFSTNLRTRIHVALFSKNMYRLEWRFA